MSRLAIGKRVNNQVPPRILADQGRPAEGLFGPLMTAAVYVVLTAAVLVPVLAVQVPCLGDYLNHLARIRYLNNDR